jgi:hypothetical protein
MELLISIIDEEVKWCVVRWGKGEVVKGRSREEKKGSRRKMVSGGEVNG